MRLLVASPSLPNRDASHGGGVYLGAFVEALARHAEVALACFVRPSETRWGARPPPGLARCVSVPFPQLIDLSGPERWRHKLRMLSGWGAARRPLLAAKHWSGEMVRKLATLNRDFRPDAVLVEFAVMAQYLPLFADQITVLTDHESGEPLPGEVGPWGLGRARDRRLWVRYVHRHYPRATVLQALNTEDAARLQEMLQRPVDVRPLVVPLPDASADPGAAPPRALFFGDYAHHPNPEAAQRLAREVWPRVREQVADAELVLAGPRADAGITELAALPGVRWLGYVEDLAGLLGTVRLVLAPLFSGSGSRMKILTALAHGLPVVSNALGLRGVDARSPAVERAESTERLTAAAAALLRDPGAARIAGTAARRWAEQHVSPDALARAQIDKLAGLRA